MNLQQIVARIFPDGTVVSHGNLCKVRLKSAHSRPRQCRILAQGADRIQRTDERREFFLLKVQDVLLSLRITGAQSENGYCEQAEVLRYAGPSDDHVAFKKDVRGVMKELCA